MAQAIRTIGICSGGVDCAGINAVIPGATKAVILDYGWRVVGLLNGAARGVGISFGDRP